MRDTTLWRKDADGLRQALIKAFRVGDGGTIANAERALLALLRRADRLPQTVRKTTAERRLSAIRMWEKRRAARASAGDR
jgi:hypothetical protein